MSKSENGKDDDEHQRVVLEAGSVEGIVELTSQFNHGIGDIPDELEPAVEGLRDAYEGLQIAMERDSRGKSRKKVREYSGRDDIGSGQFGNLLRVLEAFGLAVQDGNRWRVSDEVKE